MPTVKYQSPPKEVNHVLPWENEPVAHNNNMIYHQDQNFYCTSWNWNHGKIFQSISLYTTELGGKGGERITPWLFCATWKLG